MTTQAEALAVEWGPLYEVDLSSLPAQTIGASGSYTIGGRTWWAKGNKAGNHAASAIVPGEGLRFTIAGSLGYWPTGSLPSGFNTQVLTLPLAQFGDAYDPELPLLVEAHFTKSTPLNTSTQSIAIGLVNAAANGSPIEDGSRASQVWWGFEGTPMSSVGMAGLAHYTDRETNDVASTSLAAHAYALLFYNARDALGLHGPWPGDFVESLAELGDRVSLTTGADRGAEASVAILLNSQSAWTGAVTHLRVSQPRPLGYNKATLAGLRDAAVSLLPPGRALSRRLESMVVQVLEALVMEPARVHLTAQDALRDASPRLARGDGLAAWEEAAGTAPDGTEAERALRAAAVIRGAASRTRSAFAAAAAAEGFTLVGPLTVEAPFFRAGSSAAGDSAPGDGWAFVFTASLTGPVNAPALARVQAAYDRLRRAHTVVRAVRTGP